MMQTLEDYKDHVKRHLMPISNLLPSIASGDFSKRLDIPLKHDEFTELYASINYMLGDLQEQLKERERAEEESIRFSTALKITPDSVMITNLNGNIIEVNKAAQKLLGIENRNELIGKNAQNFIIPKNLEKALRDRQEILEKGYVRNREYYAFNKEGFVIPVEFSSALMKDVDGNPKELVAIIRDVTERKKAEEVVRKKEEKYRALVENANEAIIVAQDGMLKFFNLKAMDLTGYSEREFASIPFLNFIHPEDRDVVMHRPMSKFEEAEFLPPNPIRVIDKKKNVKWVNINAALIDWEERPATLIFLNDVTERKLAEEALRETEVKYSALVENSKDGIVIIQDGIIKFVNNSSMNLMGYPSEEIIGEKFLKFVAENHREMAMKRYIDRMSGKDVPNIYEISLNRKDGTTFTVELNASMIEYEGRPADMVFVRDITQRRKAEEELRESEEDLRDFFNNVTDIIQQVGPKGDILHVNKAWCQTFGYTEEEALKLNIMDIIHPDNLSHCMEIFDRVKHGEILSDIQTTFIGKGGQEIIVEGNANGRFENGHFVKSRGVFRNITGRKKAEETLRSSEERLKILFEYAPDAIYLMDFEGNFIDGNKATEEAIGYKRDELIGKDFLDLKLLAKESIEKAAMSLANNIRGEPTGPEEFVLNRKDGTKVTVEIRTFPVNIKGQDLVLGIARDITERKQAEEQLIQSEKLAGVGTLASGIAHEINNPLSGIMGYSEMLLEENDLSSIRKYSQKIKTDSEKIADIVKWLSRYSRQAKDHNITDVDLNVIIDESLEALKHTRKSFEIEVIKDYKEIPNIRGNKSELQQIFVNLMNNCVDAMKDGGKMNFSTTSNNGFVEVKVSDEGEGIPKECINKVFDPFFTTKDVGQGTGLGLYVTSMIVKKHHGTIEVNSEIGKGTTFNLRFPLSEVKT